jgi:hypothetical protein
MSTDPLKLSFDELYELKQFVDLLRNTHRRSLMEFRDDGSRGFKLTTTQATKNKISISSTATCVGSLFISGVWKSSTSKDDPRTWVNTEEALLKDFLRTKWTSAGLPANNPFSVAFAVESVCLLLEQLKTIDPVHRRGNSSVDSQGTGGSIYWRPPQT